MRTLAVLAVALLAGVSAADTQGSRVRVRLPGHHAIVALDTLATYTTLPVTPAEVFHVAAAALEVELKIALPVRDSTRGIVGNHDVARLRSIGGRPLSEYVNCGTGMTGPHADNYRVTLAIFAFVEPLPDRSSRLGVALAAGARDVQGVSTEPVACGTTGALEARIRRVVGARFGVAVRQ